MTLKMLPFLTFPFLLFQYSSCNIAIYSIIEVAFLTFLICAAKKGKNWKILYTVFSIIILIGTFSYLKSNNWLSIYDAYDNHWLLQTKLEKPNSYIRKQIDIYNIADSHYYNSSYELKYIYFFDSLINNTPDLREKTVLTLACQTKNKKHEAFFVIFYCVSNPLTIFCLLNLGYLFRKNWSEFTITLFPLIKTLFIFLLTSKPIFIFYLPIYLEGYIVFYFMILFLLQKNKEILEYKIEIE